MARRRRNRGLRRGAVVGGVMVAVLVYWLWPGEEPAADSVASESGAPPTLIGEAGPAEQPERSPALTPLSQVRRDEPGGSPRMSEARGDTIVRPPHEESQVPATRPAVETRPADTAAAAPRDGRSAMEAGLAAVEQKDLLDARENLNQAIQLGLTPDALERARTALSEVSRETLLSRTIVAGDPLVENHVVRSGDTLAKIARRYRISEDLLAEINGVADKNFIREGRRYKVLRGPFHATVDKSEHLVHLYLQEMYVQAFKVALGANGSTPTGLWKVANHQENPGWTDPRTGKRWHPDDPENPIGEFWIGLEGVEGEAVGQFGYGIHGTNEPDSIGRNVSMGCVRLAPGDIDLVYKLLLPGESMVKVVE